MNSRAIESVYGLLGVRPVINAAGIYTDLGGSVLSPTVRDAVHEVNGAFASMTELLDRSGERIAELLGVEAARVVPGASAGIALSVGACMTRADGRLMEQLPTTAGMRSLVLMQPGHHYKYDRCARMTGAHIVEGDLSSFADVACVLHPAHLEGQNGTLPLTEVAARAHEHGVPVVVDAAYMSYPTDLIASYGEQGADLTMFSAKYFWGPNAGGFVYGTRELIDSVAQIDFTRFESGQHLIFGRAFKMDRSAVVGTVLALEEWLAMDHDARWDVVPGARGASRCRGRGHHGAVHTRRAAGSRAGERVRRRRSGARGRARRARSPRATRASSACRWTASSSSASRRSRKRTSRVLVERIKAALA